MIFWIILQMVVTVLLNTFQLLQIVSQSQLQILCCGVASLRAYLSFMQGILIHHCSF